jgi:phosphoenolpyruvate synthase/pyruvate phosphate dikinase
MPPTSKKPLWEDLPPFDRNFLDPETPLSCIGQGAIGGKAQGLATIRQVLNSNFDGNDFRGISIDIPGMAVICTDVFDTFMVDNDLDQITCSDLTDDRIAHAFQKAELPFEILGDLRVLIEQVNTPLAIRSSSMLEDEMQEPFAGIYTTKMIPNNLYDPDIRFRQLMEAIKLVYASTFFRSAKEYRKMSGHHENDEKMAVIIQKVVGKRYHTRFYPELSGVARSYNFYPMKPARPEDGVVDLALGLGKTIVDGGIAWSYSPAYPKAEPPYGSVDNLLQETQTEFWAVNMGETNRYSPTRETEYLIRENLTAADKDGSLRYLASTYNAYSGRLTPGISFEGARALTFAPLLVLKEVPVNDLIQTLLSICENELHTDVEIEFAMSFNPHRFSFLQVRPMIVRTDYVQVDEDELYGDGVLIASENALGNGVDDGISDIVYIKPDSFDLKHSKAIIPELEQFNAKLLDMDLPYVLMSFGRLGTTDPWLGIPVKWGQICGAKVIVEATMENIRVDLSQGSHFFHNIINLGIKYFSIPFSSQFKVDWEWLDKQEVVVESQFVRHVRLHNPLYVKVDGRSGRGVIRKAKNEYD